MKVKTLKKMHFKKVSIAKINKTISYEIKGGTRSFGGDSSGFETQCGDVNCY